MRLILLLIGCAISFYTYAADMKLKSSAFWNGYSIPVLYSCDGKGFSPQLSWSNAPAKTQTFALVVADPNAPAGTWYHWIVYNIPNTTTEFAENIQTLPAGTLTGKNSSDKETYFAPCPPPGDPHHYIFTLYALDTKLNLPGGADLEALEKAMLNHVLATTTLTGTFGRE